MKLKTKFSLLISALVIIIISGVTLLLLIAESRFLKKEMENSRANIIKSFAQVAKESVIVKDEIMLLNYLKLLKTNKGLVYSLITDASGKVIAHTDTNFLGEKLTDPVSLKASEAKELLAQNYTMPDNTRVLELAVPVSVNDVKAGTARIGLSREVLDKSVKETLAATQKRIFAVAAAALVLGVLGAILLTAMMAGPINRIAKGAQIIGQGNLNHKISVTSRDELGDLAEEFNRMSDKLKELDQMKQDFVSSVTHELRSPLLSLKMYIDLFFKGTAGEINEKQKNYLEIMRDCSGRLSRFIDDLLDVAKIERGKMEVTMQPTDIAPVIRDIEMLFKPQVDSKSIRLETSVQKNMPNVMADADRTRQVIINLVSNAVKFTPENGKITLEARVDDHAKLAVISVTDTGIGIPSDKLEKVFDKFEQVTDARKKVSGPKGTGLGLSIVKGIVELQGGKIRVESSLNHGSTFSFTLPLASA